jgi:hypothetical protein
MPAKDWHRRIELTSNILIIVVALSLGVVLISRYLATDTTAASTVGTPTIKPGTKLSPGRIDWSVAEKTLVLVLSTGCKYCHESAEFYSRLSAAASRPGAPRSVGVFPQSLDESRVYLADKKIAIGEVVSASPAEFQVRGTPTLILVNRDGIVLDSWVGKLSQEKENEVFERIFADVVPK